MDFGTLISTLTNWVIQVGSTVHDLPGSVAFALGLFTWFAVEQILRRVMSGLRWIILAGALAGLGVSVPYIAGLLMDAGAPEVSDVQPSN